MQDKKRFVREGSLSSSSPAASFPALPCEAEGALHGKTLRKKTLSSNVMHGKNGTGGMQL